MQQNSVHSSHCVCSSITQVLPLTAPTAAAAAAAAADGTVEPAAGKLEGYGATVEVVSSSVFVVLYT